MKTLTLDIKEKIKAEAIERLKNGTDYMPSEDEIEMYCTILESAWKNNELPPMNWELI